ncbi:MAG: CUB domain-containing protein, partial [Bacteroidia bacterium]|nr:CUB domain-containing protein [Bacteroidia bacterium]
MGAVQYTWAPATGLNTTTGAVVVASPVSTTVYTVTARDANNCISTATATINVSPLNATITSTPASSLTASDGQIQITPTQGQPPFEFSLNGGPFQSSSAFLNLTPGIYTVVIRDNTGCTRSYPNIGVGPYCSGTTTLTAQNGTFSDGSGPATYLNNTNCSWLIQPSGGATFIRITFTEFNTEAGYDFVRIYAGADANAPLIAQYAGTTIPGPTIVTGSVAFVTFTSDVSVVGNGWTANYEAITQSCNVTVSVNPSSAEVCAGQPVTLTATATGGDGNYSYSWSPPTYLNGTSGATVVSQPAANIVYTVTVFDGIGCPATATVSLTVNSVGATI